jgi:cyclopropane-fatty-acyl-phospholipid synthase
MAILDPLLKNMVRSGSLRVIDWHGKSVVYGDGTGSPITVRIHSAMAGLRMALDPQLAVGECYMDGLLTVEQGTLYDLLDLTFRQIGMRPISYPLSGLAMGLRKALRRFQQFNPVGRSEANVAHHYDLSDTLYDLFLDSDRQYSCGYVLSPDDTLEQIQAQKKTHIAAKLCIKQGHKLLDIGSGWGGLGLYLAQFYKLDVTGLTLSEEQFRVSNQRAEASSLSDRVKFKKLDYRLETGVYDRIVSVGMFEHVGVNHFETYFRKIYDCMNDDGVALLHAIGRADTSNYTNPWISKYIFPGGYCPRLSEVTKAIEKSGLLITDIEILRLHYAETLRLWRERFDANRNKIRALFDERFCRMWEFYLMTSEFAFRYQGQMVFQIQLAKKARSVPITRNYIEAFEASQPPAPVIAPL